MQDPSVNFYDVQKEFNDYWQNRTIEKGKGWKQFKRWENFIRPRVYPDGVQNPHLLMEEYINMQNANNMYRMMPPNVWTQVGPSNVPLESSGRKRGIGRVNSIAFHPTDVNTLYVGAPAGGFWKSIDAGQTWNTTTDFLTNLGVSDIAINPNNPDEIYIITGDRDGGDTYAYGLMKSIDGGLTFNTTGLSFNITSYYRGNRVLIDPNNTNIIIVATSNGIYRSSDAGANFINTYSSVNMTDIEFHVTNSNIIYGASKGNTSIYKSIDNGVSWSQSGTGLPSMGSVVRACVAVTEDNPSVVYALFGNNSNGFYGLYKSSDEGASWNEQSDSPNLLGWSTTGSDNDGQAWYDLALTIDPNNENIVFVGGVNCWKSDDSGQNWTLNTHWYGGGGANYKHADVHMLKYNLINNNIYSCNDGGLYVSVDNGDNWTDISDGLQISQFYSLGVAQTVQDKVITGAQDNGTLLKNSIIWDAVIGGDGMECIIDYTNSNIMYGALYYGDIRKSTNGGNSFSSIAPANNGAWETPYELDKNNPDIIYAGYDEIYKTTDGGNNWNIITSNQTNGGKIDEIAVSKSNPNVIYFSDNANIFSTTDGGSNWNQINNNLPYKYISYIIVHPLDPNKVWVTFSGYNSGEKVYKSINGGNNWVNISGTLPNIPVNCIELDQNDSLETVYIGTDLGVFVSDSTLSDWNQFNNNSLPNVIVTELEIQYQSNKLIAATYGRGLWNINLEITSPPIAEFSYSDSIFCNVPADVSFVNNSFYSNTYYWDFGDGSTSTSANPTHTYNSFGLFTVKLVCVGPLGVDSVIKQQIISIDPGNSCITTLPVSGAGSVQTQCNGTLYDVGGPNSNYYDQNDCWITIAPPGSNQITLDFISFDVEAPSSSTYCNWDYLEIFDGADTSAPSLGQYCNVLTGSPGIVNSSGGAITVYLHSDQAVNGTGFEALWSCQFPSAPPVSYFSLSDTVSCDGSINFIDLSSNGPTSWFWDFGDGNTSNLQNPSHTYSGSGLYTVKLITNNQFGVDTLIWNNAVTVLDLDISVVSDTVCGSSSLNLSANSINGIINWYSDSLASNFLATGNNYTTPVLNNTTTYYTQSAYNFSSINGGPSDNSFGSGSYYQGDRHLVFDNYKNSTLVSVLVYANSSGNRTIELRNSSNLVLEDTTINIPYSPNGIRIYLNFELPVENNLQLGISAANSDLFRTDAGAIFPYNISNIVSITGTNAPAGYYYFFYDWEIKLAPCVSDVYAVNAVVNYPNVSNTTVIACDDYIWDGITYTTSGVYTNVYTNAAGCDSTHTLNVTINNSTTSTNSVAACDDYIWDGITYTTSGVYTNVYTNAAGCDSTHTLNLTINNSITSTNSVAACDDYIWDGITYTTSGVYTNVYTNAVGCDSTHILNLTINNSPLCVISQDPVTFELTANVSGGVPPYLYEWYSSIFLGSGQTILPQNNDGYFAVITDFNNCISDTCVFEVTNIPTGINEITLKDLIIYPNPSKDIFYIMFNSRHNQNIDIRISNILGQEIILESLQDFKGLYINSFDLSNKKDGLYLLEIETDNGQINKKIIKN